MSMFDMNFDKAANIRRTIAVEFRDNAVRLLQFRRVGGGYTLQSFSEGILPEGMVVEGVIKETSQVAKLLTEMMSQAQPQSPDTNYAICLVPQEHIFMMSLDIPDMAKEEAGKVLANRVGDVVPMDESLIYWDWHRLGRKDGKLNVQLAAVPKDLVDSYITTIKEAKLIPLLLEPSAEAANRVGRSSEGDARMFLVELTKGKAIVSIANGENVLFSTELKVEANPVGEVNGRNIIQKIDELVRYTETKEQATVQKGYNVRLYGETATVDSMLASFKKLGTQHNVSRIKYQHNADNPISQLLPSENLDSYVPLIGAAIRGLPNYNIDEVTLNFVPQSAKDTFIRRELVSILRRYLAFISVDVALIVIAMTLILNQLQGQVTSLEARQAAIQSLTESKRVQDLEKSINLLNQDSAEVIAINNNVYVWTPILEQLSESVPQSITIMNLSFLPPAQGTPQDKYTLSLAGRYNNRLDVISFVDRLRATKTFTDVKLPVSSLEGEAGGLFTIEAKLAIANLKPDAE